MHLFAPLLQQPFVFLKRKSVSLTDNACLLSSFELILYNQITIHLELIYLPIYRLLNINADEKRSHT